MRKIYFWAFTLAAISQIGHAATYDVANQTQFDAALTASAVSSEDNTINVNASAGVAITSSTTVSGNSPNQLAININGVDSTSILPFAVNAALSVNAQGDISLISTASSTVQMNISSPVTQTGGTISAQSGSKITIQDGGSYVLNGGTLQVGGANGLSTTGTGVFRLGATTSEAIEVIDSNLTLNMTMNMDLPAPPTNGGVATLNTNGFDAIVSGTLITATNTSGFPVFQKTGVGNLTLEDFTVTGGGEYHLVGGTTSIVKNVSIPYFAVGTGSGANTILNIADSNALLTVTQPDAGNESSGFQIGDFGGTATVNHSAGTVYVHDSSFNISNQGGTGTYNLNGGTINFTSLNNAVSYFNIGRNMGANPATTGILNISDGLLNAYKTNGNVNVVIGSRVASSGASSSGVINQTGGTFRFNGGANLFLAGFGNGIYNLTGGNLEVGGTSLQGVFTGGSGTYQFNFGGAATIRVIESNLNTSVNMTLLPGGNGAIDTNGFDATFSGTLTSSGALTKKGAGTLLLSGINNYSGGTTVNAGILRGNTDGVQGNIVNNASVIFDQAIDGEYSGNMSGSGQLTKLGAGTLLLSGANNYIGGTTVSTGTLQGTTTSLQGDIVNNAIVTFDQSFDGTYAGNLSGSGEVVKSGAGTLIFTGTNNYSDGTSILAGELQGNTNNLQGAIDINIFTLTFNQQTQGSFTGILSGNSSATLNKTGVGTLNFTSDQSTFGGVTHITEGKLALNNNLGGNVHVAQSGTLSGIGTVLGNLFVDEGGTLSPGNSPGILHVMGNYTQGPAGIYLVTIDGTQNSALFASMAASLSGTLSISLVNGVSIGTTYDILHADGGVSGTLSPVLANPVLIPKITYTPTDVLLTLTQDFTKIAITKNQKAIAAQLNTLTSPNPAEEAVLNQLIVLSSDPATIGETREALDAISGQPYINGEVRAEITENRLTNIVFNTLRTSIAISPCFDCDGDFQCCGITPWLAFNGGHISFRGNREASGFKTNEYTVIGGIQTTLNSIWTLGIAGSYEDERTHDCIGGHSRIHTGSCVLYGLYRPKIFYVWGDVDFGWSRQKTRRKISIGTLEFTAHGKPNLERVFGYLESGYDFFYHSLLIQPFAGVQVGHFKRHGIHETDADFLNLNIASKNYTRWFSRLGVHVTSFSPRKSLQLGLDLFWQHRYGGNHRSMHAHFDGFGDDFTIVGAPLSNDSLFGSLFLSKRFTDHLEGYVEASGQWWKQAQGYHATVGIKYCW